MIIIIISSLLCRAVHVCQTWVMLGRYRFPVPNLFFNVQKNHFVFFGVHLLFFFRFYFLRFLPVSVFAFTFEFGSLCVLLWFYFLFLTYLISTLCISSCVFLSVFAGLSVFPPELLAFILCASWHSWLVSLLWLWCFPLWTMVNQTFN